MSKYGVQLPGDMAQIDDPVVRDFLEPYVLFGRMHPVHKQRDRICQMTAFEYLSTPGPLQTDDLQHLLRLMGFPALSTKKEIRNTEKMGKGLKQYILECAFGSKESRQVLERREKRMAAASSPKGPSLTQVFEDPKINGLNMLQSVPMETILRQCEKHGIEIGLWDEIQSQSWSTETKENALRLLVWDRCHSIVAKRDRIRTLHDMTEQLSAKRKQKTQAQAFQTSKRPYTQNRVSEEGKRLLGYLTLSLATECNDNINTLLTRMSTLHPDWSMKKMFLSLPDAELLWIAQNDPVWKWDFMNKKSFAARIKNADVRQSRRERLFGWVCRDIVPVETSL